MGGGGKINKNKITIKSDNIEKFYTELLQKVQLHKEKVKMIFYKQIILNTAIINTATKEESDKLTVIISDRIQEAQVQQENLLDPTICIFRDSNISEEDIEVKVLEAYDRFLLLKSLVQRPVGSTFVVHEPSINYFRLKK